MKKMIVILDGLGDLPCSQFAGKTPLEFANTPNLDWFAKNGRQGQMFSVSEKIIPQSDSAVVAILGNDPGISSRGQFEAYGLNIKLQRGDLAMRANFGTVDNIKNRRMIDRRAGRTLTTKEAMQLANSINKGIKLPVKFEFHPTLQHRGVLVLRGGFSDNITDTDAHYMELNEKKDNWLETEKFSWSNALDDDENTEFTANVLNSFIDQSYKVLENHPINLIRKKRGLMPANVILTRGAGIELPQLKKFRKSMAIVNMALEKGICKAAGMEVFDMDYPKMKGYDVYENLYRGLTKMTNFAVKIIKRKGDKYDFVYVHFKETDTPGHDNKPFEKKNFIELIDKKFFSFLKNYAQKNKLKLIVTGDHSTPCKMKDHSADPVPVLFYEYGENPDGINVFSEAQAAKGSLGKFLGKNLLKKTGLV